MQAQLGPKDYLRQDQFVHWFVHQSTEKPSFPTVVLFMDEVCCNRKGIFNSHSSHVWAEANPHAASVHCHQQCFVVNIWVDNDFLMGLTCYPNGSVHRFTAIRNTEGNPVVSQDKRGFRQQGCGSVLTSSPRTSHRHLQR